MSTDLSSRDKAISAFTISVAQQVLVLLPFWTVELRMMKRYEKIVRLQRRADALESPLQGRVNEHKRDKIALNFKFHL
ncbi:MAG: hypothetical protein FJW26_06355 [Acidimicrobiia bacterium]|nr:hypothetical protein [Acidimicrobiia bacterium]